MSRRGVTTTVRLRAVSRAICVDASPADAGALSEGSLETLRKEHHLILNAAGEGIYGLDLEGRASFVNPAAAALTGQSVDEREWCTTKEHVVHHVADHAVLERGVDRALGARVRPAARRS